MKPLCRCPTYAISKLQELTPKSRLACTAISSVSRRRSLLTVTASERHLIASGLAAHPTR